MVVDDGLGYRDHVRERRSDRHRTFGGNDVDAGIQRREHLASNVVGCTVLSMVRPQQWKMSGAGIASPSRLWMSRRKRGYASGRIRLAVM